MRTLIMVTVGFLAAVTFAIIVQVIIVQATESGTLEERVSSVLRRQFSAEASARPPATPAGRGRDAADAQSAVLSSIRISDMTAADLETLLHHSTQADLAQLRESLTLEAERRDKAGFWTDVKLNSLFLFLGFAVPSLFTRRRT